MRRAVVSGVAIAVGHEDISRDLALAFAAHVFAEQQRRRMNGVVRRLKLDTGGSMFVSRRENRLRNSHQSAEKVLFRRFRGLGMEWERVGGVSRKNRLKSGFSLLGLLATETGVATR
jgi:hypothetical protein